MSLKQRPQGLTAASCHTRAELEHAMQLELDFAVLGPVKDKSPALGWDRFRDLAAFSSIPIYAIGGLARRHGGRLARRRAWPGYDSGGLELDFLSSGRRYSSDAHLPRSIILQRSLQNGRHLFSGEYSVVAPQRGQETALTDCRT